MDNIKIGKETEKRKKMKRSPNERHTKIYGRITEIL